MKKKSKPVKDKSLKNIERSLQPMAEWASLQLYWYKLSFVLFAIIILIALLIFVVKDLFNPPYQKDILPIDQRIGPNNFINSNWER
ncbi:MAG: hypothetical protein WCV81_04765 [Microgenomates group bacterium]|jgi:hypothetical protein